MADRIALTMPPHAADKLLRALLDAEPRLPANHAEEAEWLRWAQGRLSAALFEYREAERVA